jgi:triosephosphate isomerase
MERRVLVMKKLVVFNWKCNPAHLSEAKKLLQSFTVFPRASRVVVCPPFPFLFLKFPRGIMRGAQDVASSAVSGPYTGAVSARMLKSLGVSYVLVGHSERRAEFGETDAVIAEKVRAALREGLRVILCVGENSRMHRRGPHAVKRFIREQIERGVRRVSRRALRRSFIIAYEPIWAIGTGNAEKPERAAGVLRYLRDYLRVSWKVEKSVVLYGGSVTSRNAGGFVHLDDVDGFLVGGASLKRNEVNSIVQIVESTIR